MSCRIRWEDVSNQQWNERLKEIPRSTITQSAIYALAHCKVERIKVRRGVIEINGQDKGLIQIFEASLFFKAIHAVIIDRGPLWFDEFGSAYDVKILLDQLQHEFPNRFGRKRRFLPETEQSPTAAAIIKQSGWILKDTTDPYKTVWLDITEDETVAREKLHKGWKGSLKKAEQSSIEIEWDVEGVTYPFFKHQYLADKQNKAYMGLSPQLLDNMALFSTKDIPMIIGNAKVSSDVVAAVLFFIHGRNATYQIGWTSEVGRENCAHHLLLWRSRDILKTYGIRELDLGGINDHNKGLSRFKKGTGGQPVTLVGHYL